MAASQTSTRLRTAQKLCRFLPPLVAQKVRNWVYPPETAYRDDCEFLVRAQTGSFFRSRTSDFHGYRFGVHGYYDWRNWAVALAVCRPGDTIVEIGANIGTETVGFSDIVGRSGSVHAFEPLPSNIAALKQLIELNKLSNVAIHSCALGAGIGRARFVVPKNNCASGIGHLMGLDEQMAPTIDVEVRTLDGSAAVVGTAKLIAIDAEGAELSILNGAECYLSTHKPFVVLEASPKWLTRAGATLQELHARLVFLGYDIYGIGRTDLESVVEPDGEKAGNWFCAPPGQAAAIARVRHHLTVCGWLPCIPGVNPLSRRLR